MCTGLQVAAELPSTERAAAPCRQFVRSLLAAWGRPAAQDDAELVVAELFSNAVRHAVTELHRLELRVEADYLTVALTDASPHWPQRRTVSPAATSGRGLSIIEALARNWGVIPLASGGKRVWVELPLDEPCHNCHGTAPASLAASS